MMTKMRQEAINNMSKKACEWIELDLTNLNATAQKISQDKESQMKLAQLQQELDEGFIVETTPVEITIEKTKEIQKFVI